MHILFLSRWYPYPPNNGSKLRIFNLLNGLSRHHDISLISYFNPSDGIPDTDNLSLYCRHIELAQYKPFKPLGLRALVGYTSSSPRFVVDTFSNEIKDKIEILLTSKKCDAVIASEFDMSIYGKYFQSLPAILDDIEIGAIYEKYSNAASLLHRMRNRMTWEKLRRYLRVVLKDYQACTVVSPQELHFLKMALPTYESVELIPNFIDLDNYKNIEIDPIKNHIIFTGSFSYHPNYEAMTWFLREVYPIILTHNPDIHFTITGDPAEKTIPNLKGVYQVGFVNDVRSYIARSSCSIVPIFTGGGSRLKILEAMALGTPIVATSKGAEGLEVDHGVHLLIADEPETFANSVIRILDDQILYNRLADNAYRLVNNKYSSKVIIPKYLSLLEKNISGVV